jgi:hypothetical protein
MTTTPTTIPTTTATALRSEAEVVATAATAATASPSSGWSRAALVAAPVAWAGVALVHPMGSDGTVYEGLRDRVVLWIGVHLAQLVLSVALAAGLWTLVRGLRSPAARLARASIPFYLVLFAAFDSIVGIATGLAVHHANTTTGATREGAISTAEYLMSNPLAGNWGVLPGLAHVALVGALFGTGMALRAAGVARAIWGPVLVGLLLATHAGPMAAVGSSALALAFQRGLRRGWT